jgi:lysyl-tRNA synthetase class 2
MDLELLEMRARIIRETRAFFDRRGYLEVDTPLLAPDLIPESCLEVFETAYLKPGAQVGTRQGTGSPRWLIPSPEIWMKRLISQHRRSGPNMYQICKCFRNGESTGRHHNPEFTMLEYYTMEAGYLDSLKITEELFAALAGIIAPEGIQSPAISPLSRPVERLTMAEAFSRWAGFDLFYAAENGGLETEARRLGLDPPAGLGTAALYDLIFIHAVEPKLPRDHPTAILDYPAFVPCLAKAGGNGKTLERWELYAGGVELINCYSEETRGEEVRRFFESENRIKNETALVPHRIDPDYWKIFLPDSAGRPFPRCSGAALGLDRLIMVLTGRSTIDEVLLSVPPGN